VVIMIDDALRIAREKLHSEGYEMCPIVSANRRLCEDGIERWIVSFEIHPTDDPGTFEVLIDSRTGYAEIPDVW
jgi:hypothetical protein